MSKTVASVIHADADIFHDRIAENISNQSTDQCDKDRHSHIMADQFISGVAAGKKSPDDICLFCNGVADRNAKTNAMIAITI